MKPAFWICGSCKHYKLDSPADQPSSCTAFPNGIPVEISQNGFDHRKPYKGDSGIQFELIPGESLPAYLDLINNDK